MSGERAMVRDVATVVALGVLAACASDDGRELRPSTVTGVTTTTFPPDEAVFEPGKTVPVPSDTVPDTPIVPSTDEVPVLSEPPPTGAPDTAVATSTDAPVRPVGFDLVSATITSSEGEVCDVCLWLADDADERATGLMGVTDLGDGDGMLFRYDAPRTTQFWMKNTPLPLSIAYFDADGAYIDSTDMEPCTADPCPRYPTPRDFLDAIEFPQGTLADFLVGPGSVLTVSDLPCR